MDKEAVLEDSGRAGVTLAFLSILRYRSRLVCDVMRAKG